MKFSGICGLLLLFCSGVFAQSVPAGWKIVKESGGKCQVSVPPEWVVAPGNPGYASAKKQLDGSVVVTIGYDTLQPMPESLQKAFKVDKMFENTAKRVFYSDHLDKITNYNVSVPGKAGFTCTSQVTFSEATKDDIAKAIALSVGPAK
jgi:hypothetical protein